jgi:hypothetical protein
MSEELEGKKKFNWTEFIAVTLLVLLSAVVAAGLTWYIMDNQLRDVESQNDAAVASYQARIAALETKAKVDSAVDAKTAQPLTQAMIESGTYTLDGVKVTLVGGKAVVGSNTYALDTTKLAFTTDKTKAVIVINETTGTPATAVNTFVVAVNNKDGKANQVASTTVAAGSTVTSVAYATDGKITVVTTTATATTPTTTVYTVSGTTFTAAK